MNSYSIDAIFEEDNGAFNQPEIIGLNQSFLKGGEFITFIASRLSPNSLECQTQAQSTNEFSQYHRLVGFF